VAGPAAALLQPTLPTSLTAVEWAGFPGLFSRAAAVIHQGGVGTTAQALRAGMPQLVVPFAHDQFDNGDRIRRMGCGRMLFRSRLTEAALVRELAALLADPLVPMTARAEGMQVRAEIGAAAAAEQITQRFS
jgi:UDP:flavonoid glycosyltransferase YjiC (YdhE family)